MIFKRPIYICAAKRTAIGSFGGSLGQIPATELGATVVRSLLAESKIDPKAIEQLILGCVLSAGLGQAPTRQVVLRSGLPQSTNAMTLNKVCSSGLKAVILGATEIEVGAADVLIAGGMENMSLAPYIMPSLRTGARLGNAEAQDTILRDGLLDAFDNSHMGLCGELCAKKYSMDRAAQDAFAVRSYERAKEAIAAGHFTAEIAPVKVKAGKTEVDFVVDEEPGKLKLEKVPELKPAFDKNGTVTAANASSLSDGAAALLLASDEGVKRHGLKPLARIIGDGTESREPEWFTIAPIGAVQLLLKKANVQVSAVDLVEINEAFSVVAMVCGKELGVKDERLNISGGAVALGHPIGASGARILTTLVHNLRRTRGKFGVAGICNGGGEATALLVESS